MGCLVRTEATLDAGAVVDLSIDLPDGVLRTKMRVAEASVDGATCGFALRNFTDLQATLDELARVTRDRGRLAVVEVAEPPNPVLRMGHGVYFGRVVPVIGGLLSDGSAYRYLPRSVAYLPEWPELRAMAERAGFSDVRRTLLSGGIAQLITATRSARR